jgi:hypothetical protein
MVLEFLGLPDAHELHESKLEPLAKHQFVGGFISQREAKAESTGGHFWHDEVLTPTS